MKNFTGFSELWEKDPDVFVKEFMATKPLMVDLEAKFRHYRVINKNKFLIWVLSFFDSYKNENEWCFKL